MTPTKKSVPTLYPAKLLLKISIPCATAWVLGAAILYSMYSRDLGTEYGKAFYTIKNLLMFLVPALLLSLSSVILLACTAMVSIGVFASHKIAGPLFRLQRVADYLARGTVTGKTYLRDGDWIKQVAENMNAWTEAQRQLHRKQRELLNKTGEEIAACKVAYGLGDTDSVGASLKNLRANLEQLLATKT